jgi:hypothetical protein
MTLPWVVCYVYRYISYLIYGTIIAPSYRQTTTTTNHYGGLRLKLNTTTSHKYMLSIGRNYTNTCFDLLLQGLLRGGTKGLNAGYKGQDRIYPYTSITSHYDAYGYTTMPTVKSYNNLNFGSRGGAMVAPWQNTSEKVESPGRDISIPLLIS